MPEKMFTLKDMMIFRNLLINIAGSHINNEERLKSFIKELNELIKLHFKD